MKFLLACRTARLLPSLLLGNGLKPFPANTAGTFSTYIFCHNKNLLRSKPDKKYMQNGVLGNSGGIVAG
jgi:hypothetical protein